MPSSGYHPSDISSSSFVGPEENHNNQNFRGQRFMLLTSLDADAIMSLLASTISNLRKLDKKRNPLIIFVTGVLTTFYSPRAGASPFPYCGEVFPHELNKAMNVVR